MGWIVVPIQAMPRVCHEPCGKLVELGGVGEKERIVLGKAGEIGMGGGVAELLEVVFGLVPEFAHKHFFLFPEPMQRIVLWFGRFLASRGFPHLCSDFCTYFICQLFLLCLDVVDPGLNGVFSPHASTGLSGIWNIQWRTVSDTMLDPVA